MGVQPCAASDPLAALGDPPAPAGCKAPLPLAALGDSPR